jgi:hypothetical protein
MRPLVNFNGQPASYARLAYIAVFFFATLGNAVTSAQEKTEESKCSDTAEGRVCTVEERIVAGTAVSTQTQENLGLVTVGGGCSGTLINRNWVLTADHCVADPPRTGGNPVAFHRAQITAAWTGTVATPTRFVRNWWYGRGMDVALVYLGNGDLGGTTIKQDIHVHPPNIDAILTKFGRGLASLAVDSGGTHIPAAPGDGRYRSARFVGPGELTDITNTAYDLRPNALRQVGMAGDSGGPDRLTVIISPGTPTVPATVRIDDIVGVQTTCRWDALPGHPTPPQTWVWVWRIRFCTSVPVWTIRDEIREIIRERPSGPGDLGIPCSASWAGLPTAGCGIVEISSLLMMR